MLLRNERGKYLSDEIGQIAPREKLEESKAGSGRAGEGKIRKSPMVRKIRSMRSMVTSECYSLSRKRGAGQARSRRVVRDK